MSSRSAFRSLSIAALTRLVLTLAGCSTREGGSPISAVGYGNFVRLNGIVYSEAGGKVSATVDRSSVFGRTKLKLQDGSVTRPGGAGRTETRANSIRIRPCTR